MRWTRSVLIVIAAALVAGASTWAWHATQPRMVTATFDPPYPETSGNGDPILVVLEGRIPCTIADCEKRKVALVLYATKDGKEPTSYWLGVIGTQGNDRIVTKGRWELRQGLAGYPNASVVALDAQADPDLRYFWRVNDDIALPLDEHMSPRTGNSAWGYMLSRYDAPYGPRTYTYLQR
jgi:hypothetical protein